MPSFELACIKCGTTVIRKINCPDRAKCKGCLAATRRAPKPGYARAWIEANRDKVRVMRRKASNKWAQTPAGKASRAQTEARRRTRVRRATPAWADLSAIEAFYAARPEGMTVDHVLPVAGKNVSGLHVIENLQYLTMEQNQLKHTYVVDEVLES